jgi:hypothetical protein
MAALSVCEEIYWPLQFLLTAFRYPLTLMFPSEPALQSAVSKILSDLEANEAAVDAVMAGLDEIQLNWKPSPKFWSIAQCLDHLVRANGDYLGGAVRAVQAAKPARGSASAPIEAAFLERLFLWVVEPPARLRVKSPKSGLPSASVDPAHARAELLRTHAEMRALIRQTGGLDLNRIVFPNPFFRLMPIRVGTALLMVPAHERRHIWQANNIRKALESHAAPPKGGPSFRR